MADPTYQPELNGGNRRADKLEIRVDPEITGTPTTFDRIPTLSEFTPYQPNVSVSRKPLYDDGIHTNMSIASASEDGGTIEFRTAAPAGNTVVRKLFGAKNEHVMYKATYTDGLVEQGQAVLVYLGRQGGTTDVPEYGWRLEVITNDTVLPTP